MAAARKSHLAMSSWSARVAAPAARLRSTAVLFLILAQAVWLEAFSGELTAAHIAHGLPGLPRREPCLFQDQVETTFLEPGKPLARQLAFGQSHTYQVAVAANQYLQVVVEQQGNDIEVSIMGPDGQKLADMDGPFGSFGPESVSVLSAVAGVFTVKVHSTSKGSGSGGYEIRLAALREPAPADRSRITAERIFMQARGMPKGEAQVAKYKEALPHWENAGDLYGQARTLYNVAGLYQAMNQTREAAETLSQVAAILAQLPYPRALAITRNSLALMLGFSGYLRQAAENFQLTLAYWESLNDPSGTATILNNLGMTYANLGEPQQAFAYHEQALKLRQQLDRKSDVAQSLINIGLVFDRTAEWQKGLEQYFQALSLLRSIQSPTPEERSREATALNNIGYDYALLGDPQTALDYFNESLAIRKTLNKPGDEGTTLGNIGNAYFLLDDPEKALAFCSDALPKLNNWGGAYNLINLGNIHRSMGNAQRALDYYQQALTGLNATDDRQGQAAALNNIGRTYAGLNDLEKAEQHYARALSLWRACQDKQGEATALLGLARLARQRQNFGEAAKLLDDAIAILETTRMKLTSWELRSSYFISAREYYDLAIDLHMTLHKQSPAAGHDVTALRFSERGRARTLQDMLAEANVVVDKDIPPELVARRRELEQRISAMTAAQLQSARGKLPGSEKAEAEAAMRALLNEYEQLEARIRGLSPRYAALTRPQPATIAEIQNQILDPDTLLVEYALGEERSYVWLVSRDAVESYALPNRKEIESEVSRFYDLITAREPVAGETGAQAAQRVSQADLLYPGQAAKLSALLLGPLAGKLGQKRLLIIAEGGLHRVPFSALPEPSPQPASAGAAIPVARRGDSGLAQAPLPLIVNHEIVTLPSASVLAVARREMAGRKSPSKQAFVFANPVFNESDDRIQPTNKMAPRARKSAPKTGDRLNVWRDVQSTLPPLPSTVREAEAIMRVTAPGQGMAALDFKASRAMAMSAQIQQYGIVHFATHALLNDIRPELSGVVLSLFDKDGKPQDGLLSLHDIFTLKLSARLVVLSACRTGLGKEVRGEGVIGLTRGFMYAGAKDVITTLWRVNDLTTASFMQELYKQMLVRGLSPAAALRRVQIDRLKHSPWKHPYYWAPFVLTGDYQ